jgi:hypothetical protein
VADISVSATPTRWVTKGGRVAHIDSGQTSGGYPLAACGFVGGLVERAWTSAPPCKPCERIAGSESGTKVER